MQQKQQHQQKRKTWNVGSGADLGRAIAELRRDRGMTQAELAAAGGLSRTWLAKLETGRSSVVIEHLLRLLHRLGATVIVVTGDDDA